MTVGLCDQLLNLIMAICGTAVATLEDTKKWLGILKFSLGNKLFESKTMSGFEGLSGAPLIKV